MIEVIKKLQPQKYEVTCIKCRSVLRFTHEDFKGPILHITCPECLNQITHSECKEIFELPNEYPKEYPNGYPKDLYPKDKSDLLIPVTLGLGIGFGIILIILFT